MGFVEFHGGSEDMDGMDMGDDGMSGGDSESSSMGMSMMKMYLHFTKGDNVLFKSIAPSSAGAIFGCCLILFFIAILDRYVCALFHKLDRHHAARSQKLMLVYGENESSANDCCDDDEPPKQLGQSPANHTHRFILSHQLTRAALVGLEKTLHYLLMLVVMTFNASYIISVVLGAAVGEFIFGRPHSP